MSYRTAAATPDIAQIGFTTLVQRGFTAYSDVSEETLRTIQRGYGWGPDYLAGEVIFAVSEGGSPFLFTSRMLVGPLPTGAPVFLLYSDMISVVSGEAGIFDNAASLVIRAPNGVLNAPGLGGAQVFFDAILALPPAERVALPRMIEVHASEADPMGARTALEHLFSTDTRIPILLRMADDFHRRGWVDPTMENSFVRRVHLLDRTLKMGRGMSGGWWLTSLGATDLAAHVGRIAGRAIAFSPGPPMAFDFEHGEGRAQDLALGAAGGAVALVLDPLSIFDVVGDAANSSATFDGLRLVVDEQPGATRFQLVTPHAGQWAPLSRVSPGAFDAFVKYLADEEARVTLARLVLGFQTVLPTDHDFLRRGIEGALAQRGIPMSVGEFFPIRNPIHHTFPSHRANNW